MNETKEVIKVERVLGSVDLATLSGIVLPSRDAMPMTRFHKLNIQHVRFDAGYGHKVGWKDGKDLYMHANHQLDTLFMAAGAEVLANEIVTSDDQGDPLPANVFRHHFAAKIILPSGKVAMSNCYKTWDLRSLEEGGTRAQASLRRRQKQLEEALAGVKNAKWPKGLARKSDQETMGEFQEKANIFLERLVEDEMVERRVFGQELAEAGAKSRAIYDMTGLKMGVPKEEFEQDIWVVTSLFNVEEALSKLAGTQEGQQLLALVALAQEQAFGAMGGAAIPGGAEALKLLRAVQEVTPQAVEEAIGDLEEEIEPQDQAIESDWTQPPEEDFEPVPADVLELMDEVMAEEMGASGTEVADALEEALELDPETREPPKIRPVTDKERGDMIDYLAWCGYGKGVPQANLLKTLFECTLGTVNVLQAKILCQYGRDTKAEARANAERTEGKMDTKMFKAWKDGHKVLARQAYKAGMDLDAYLQFMQGK